MLATGECLTMTLKLYFLIDSIAGESFMQAESCSQACDELMFCCSEGGGGPSPSYTPKGEKNTMVIIYNNFIAML